MKYRRLSKEELSELKTEFVRFLAAHSIPADDWEKLKSETPEVAENWIDKFSDLVFEKTLTDINYLELRSAHNIQIVKVDEIPFIMRGIRVIDNPYLNFLDESSPQTWNKILKEHGGKLQTFQASKMPKEEVNKAKFEFMENGYLILKDPKLFDSLEKLQDNQSG
ncbi:MAG: hypothetical protein GVX78_05590 [Bacteroidetes bacterium]|jgi:putative sterol carrier protein|nr:hypothetical protein [Bacteroidota bacterium]